ncbi:MAG TPA: MBL fold metallo-hydrolase [Gemmatimonadales bacterium]|nr:MBL fold metallo-hydrolase [Gemmatimonadales bacterium]
MPLVRHGALRRRLAFAHRFARAAAERRREERAHPIRPAPRRPDPTTWRDDRITLAWLGHATVLLNVYGTWLLTDPALASRVGLAIPGITFGPRRLVAPALLAHELPRLDGVLLSHAHMDHTDMATLRRLPRGTAAVVQIGNRDLVRRFRAVHEVGWGEAVEIGGVRIEATPARHWGARMITDRHRGYGGFLLQARGRTLLFAGDTAHTDRFVPLGRRHAIDVAMLPIGAYDPWIANHASPEEAWAMGRDLRARWVVPIHHATFRLSREPVDEPIRRLLTAAGPARDRVVVTEIGQTWTLPE